MTKFENLRLYTIVWPRPMLRYLEVGQIRVAQWQYSRFFLQSLDPTTNLIIGSTMCPGGHSHCFNRGNAPHLNMGGTKDCSRPRPFERLIDRRNSEFWSHVTRAVIDMVD
jgi:hypothetical protein